MQNPIKYFNFIYWDLLLLLISKKKKDFHVIYRIVYNVILDVELLIKSTLPGRTIDSGLVYWRGT